MIMTLDRKIYLLRLSLGLLGGLISGLVKFSMVHFGFVILIMSITYLVTIYISYKWVLRESRYDIKLVFMEGIGAFSFLWLFIWALLYNLLVIYPPP